MLEILLAFSLGVAVSFAIWQIIFPHTKEFGNPDEPLF